jgi:hypothetical protein
LVFFAASDHQPDRALVVISHAAARHYSAMARRLAIGWKSKATSLGLTACIAALIHLWCVKK